MSIVQEVTVREWDEMERRVEDTSLIGRHRRVFLRHLCRSGREYLQCGLPVESVHCFHRVGAELEKAAAAKATVRGGFSERQGIEGFSSLLERTGKNVEAMLESRKGRFRDADFKSLKSELESSLQQETSGAWRALRQCRVRLHQRLLQVHRARVSWKGRSTRTRVESSLFGPYNDRHNLESVLELLARHDPLWVEDWKAHHKELLILEALFPKDEAAKSKTTNKNKNKSESGNNGLRLQ